MVDVPGVDAEVDRLMAMSSASLRRTVVDHATDEEDLQHPADAVAEALKSPQVAPRTLAALQDARGKARSFLPRMDGESKRSHEARLVPLRARLVAAMEPLHEVLDDLAHEEAKHLAALNDTDFTQQWQAFVRDRPPNEPGRRHVLGLAFRSPRVASRAEEVCRAMLEEPARFLPKAERDESRKAREARIERFRRAVRTEQGFLQYAIQYAAARQGRMPSEPNVRRQALKLLGQAHPEELSSLLQQVRADSKRRAKEKGRERRMLRRAP